MRELIRWARQAAPYPLSMFTTATPAAQELSIASSAEAGTDGEKSIPRLVQVKQSWDGTDHTKRVVADGMYDYEVQAKVMVQGKRNGPLTRQASLKKRGKFEVRTR